MIAWCLLLSRPFFTAPFIHQKNHFMKFYYSLLGIALAVLMGGCRSSQITSFWKAPDTRARSYNKILVLGLIRDNDRQLQESMEKHLAGDLQDMGYTAISSLQEFGPKAFDKLEEDPALEKLRGSGFDAVVTIVLLDKEKERRYVPGHPYYTPYGIYYNRFWHYRSTLYFRIYEPGYYVTDTRYFWESNFYELEAQKLLYSAQSKSFDPSSTETMGHEYGKLIAKNLVKEGVLMEKAGQRGF
jgi:hypothetical protein